MPDAPAVRAAGCGLHPSHYAALRTEVLRTGDDLSDNQLLDLADALDRQVRLRRPDRPTRGLAIKSRASASLHQPT